MSFFFSTFDFKFNLTKFREKVDNIEDNILDVWSFLDKYFKALMGKAHVFESKTSSQSITNFPFLQKRIMIRSCFDVSTLRRKSSRLFQLEERVKYIKSNLDHPST